MAQRHHRRSTRPIEDLPSLFEAPAQEPQQSFEGKAASASANELDEYIVPSKYATRRRQLRFISFGSGSSGNCSYVGTESCGLLIDAGVDNNFVTKELARNGIDISTIRGILLTHDHGDHVRYSYAILRRNPGMKLYSTIKCLEGILRRHNISRRIKDYHVPIFKEHEYRFDNILVTPFETSHDGTDNCGFFFTFDNTHFAIATDTGIITERADFYCRQANSLMIEANYDDEMLATGRYTEHLKARIRSNTGHLENRTTANYLAQIYTPQLKQVFPCHLSEDNNTPETAEVTICNALRTINVRPAPSSAEIPAGTVYIKALPRFRSSDLYIL